MRAIFHSDVMALARVLAQVPEPRRARLCERLIEQTDCADRYMRRLGKPHPDWGNGTLLSRVCSLPMAQVTTLGGTGYSRCLEQVLNTLNRRRVALDI